MVNGGSEWVNGGDLRIIWQMQICFRDCYRGARSIKIDEYIQSDFQLWYVKERHSNETIQSALNKTQKALTIHPHAHNLRYLRLPNLLTSRNSTSPTWFNPGLYYRTSSYSMSVMPRSNTSNLIYVQVNSPAIINTQGKKTWPLRQSRQGSHTFHTVSSLCPFILTLLFERRHPPPLICWRGYNRLHDLLIEGLELLHNVAWYLNSKNKWL